MRKDSEEEEEKEEEREKHEERALEVFRRCPSFSEFRAFYDCCLVEGHVLLFLVSSASRCASEGKKKKKKLKWSFAEEASFSLHLSLPLLLSSLSA